MKVPTPKRNEQISIAHKKYFANFIKSGASDRSFAFEHLRIFKKSTSRSTYHRIQKNPLAQNNAISLLLCRAPYERVRSDLYFETIQSSVYTRTTNEHT